MRITELIDWRVAALAGLAAITAAWAGWSSAGRRDNLSAAPRGVDWASVTWARPDVAADAAELSRRNLWNMSKEAAPAPGAPPPRPVAPWRIVGTAVVEGKPRAIILSQSGPLGVEILLKGVGDALPDGRIVDSVEPARILARSGAAGGQLSELPLFRPK